MFVALAYGVGIVSALLSPGFILRYGGVRALQGVLAATAAMLLLAAGGSILWLAVAAVVLGLGYGAAAPASTHLLVPHTPARVFNMVMSLRQIGVPLGGVLGSLLLPPLVLHVGWRAALLAEVPAVLLLMAASGVSTPTLGHRHAADAAAVRPRPGGTVRIAAAAADAEAIGGKLHLFGHPALFCRLHDDAPDEGRGVRPGWSRSCAGALPDLRRGLAADLGLGRRPLGSRPVTRWRCTASAWPPRQLPPEHSECTGTVHWCWRSSASRADRRRLHRRRLCRVRPSRRRAAYRGHRPRHRRDVRRRAADPAGLRRSRWRHPAATRRPTGRWRRLSWRARCCFVSANGPAPPLPPDRSRPRAVGELRQPRRAAARPPAPGASPGSGRSAFGSTAAHGGGARRPRTAGALVHRHHPGGLDKATWHRFRTGRLPAARDARSARPHGAARVPCAGDVPAHSARRRTALRRGGDRAGWRASARAAAVAQPARDCAAWCSPRRIRTPPTPGPCGCCCGACR